MIWQSMTAMIAIDLIVLMMTGAMGIYLWRQRRFVNSPHQFKNLFMIFAGMAVIGLFYLADLATMTVLPKIVGMRRSVELMSSLHLNVRWVITLLAGALIVVGFIGTTRRQAELVKQLETTKTSMTESADRMSAILDLAADGMLSVSVNGTVRRVNQAARAMFSIDKSDTVEPHIDDLVQVVDSVGDVGSVLQNLESTTGKVQTARGEGIGVRSDGRKFPISYAASAFLLGEERLYTVIVSDVTDTRRLDEAVQMSQKMEALGRLAGGIAHDFNNLLAVILGNTELTVSQLPHDAPMLEELSHVEEAVRRATSLTKQLLVFSRHQGFAPLVFDLSEMINNLQPALEQAIGEGIQFEVELCDGPVIVNADPAQIEQLLLNLVINASEAINGDGAIAIKMENAELDDRFVASHLDIKPGHFTKLSVMDTGVGMDADVQKHVFEPFFTTKENADGSGLGLSTAHGVVSKAGGFITLDSERGHGSTFRIYLPISTGIPEVRNSPEPVPSKQVSGVILLAEDRDSVRRMVSEILTRAGYECHGADSGVSALELFRTNPDQFDVVLTDVLMPGMGGVELARHIRAIRADMPMLFMSGYADSSQISQKDVSDNIELMHKPFTSNEILGKIRDVIKTGT